MILPEQRQAARLLIILIAFIAVFMFYSAPARWNRIRKHTLWRNTYIFFSGFMMPAIALIIVGVVATVVYISMNI